MFNMVANGNFRNVHALLVFSTNSILSRPAVNAKHNGSQKSKFKRINLISYSYSLIPLDMNYHNEFLSFAHIFQIFTCVYFANLCCCFCKMYRGKGCGGV